MLSLHFIEVLIKTDCSLRDCFCEVYVLLLRYGIDIALL
jgi:hypothetical protein